MAGLQARLHAGCPCGLNADDANLRVEQLCQSGHARGQSAAADRHEDAVHQRKLLEDLHGDGALAAGDIEVVKGVHEREALLLGKLAGACICLVIDVAHKLDVGAVRLGALDLDERRRGGHHDGCGNAVLLCGRRHALGMVAGRGGDEAVRTLLVTHGRNLVVGTAHLVGTRTLHVLRLEEHAVPGDGAEVGALNELCLQRHFLDLGCRLLKCV